MLLEVNVPNESLSNTRNQIQSAIETLGSATPLVHNSGLDVDNDDSIYSTSISSVVQVHIHERLQTPVRISIKISVNKNCDTTFGLNIFVNWKQQLHISTV